MASIQQARHHNASQNLNDKQKAKLGKAIQEAKTFLANANASQDHEIVKVPGAMLNSNKDLTLNKIKHHDYMGSFYANPPDTILPLKAGPFVHQGATSQGPLPVVVGSKAAVIYGHQMIGGGLGWLLAWYKPAVGSNETSKVYVDAGSIERLKKLEWSEIEKKLDSSHKISRYWDSDTAAEVYAEITDYAPDMAYVGAVFDVNNETPPQAN